MPDLSALNLQAIVGLLLVLGAVDTVGSALIALGAGNFSGAYITEFLVSHVGKVWFPIIALGAIGAGVPLLGIPAIPAANLAAIASLGAYLIATVASLKASFDDRAEAPTGAVTTSETV